MPRLADELSWVERGDVLILSGFPTDEEHEWHVNIAEHVTGGPSRRMAIVLQASGASDQWLTIALEQQEVEWTIDQLAAFEGDSPSDADQEGEVAIDPEILELVDIQ